MKPRRMKRKSKKYWSGYVTRYSNALDLEERITDIFSNILSSSGRFSVKIE
jgi:hypothetical protein